MTDTLAPQALTEAGSLVGSQGPGRARIRIIEAGQGSSGLYPEQTLQEAADRQVFHAGTLMYLDHPAASESADRPERSVRDLAGRLAEDARYEDGALVADAEVFAHMRPIIEGLHESVGVSIRAMGDINADGEIVAITEARSVDYVTEAGAGGRVLELVESARTATAEAMSALSNETSPTDRSGADAPQGPNHEEGHAMSESTAPANGATAEEPQAPDLTEALAERDTRIERLERQLAERDARDEVRRHVTEHAADLPDAARARIAGSVDLASDDLETQVTEAVARERAYIAEVSGTGTVRGMGDSDPIPDNEEAFEALAAEFQRSGLDEAAAKAAARA